MKGLRIVPSYLEGKINIPPSKSISHRAIIGAGLSEGKSVIHNVIISEDIMATLEGMKALGMEIVDISDDNIDGNKKLILKGTNHIGIKKEMINCKESGSTLRFLLPIATLGDEEVTFVGEGRLIERPLNTYYNIFSDQNIYYTNVKGKLPLTIKGKIKPGIYEVEGDISSQFITGLMFALPLLENNSKILVTKELESRAYVALTIDMLNRFSIDIDNNNYKEFYIRGKQTYKSIEYKVEGDFSQAAFWIVAGILNGSIKCSNINEDSLQGDKIIIDLVKKMGGNIDIENANIIAKNSSTSGITINVSQCPDLVPILAVLGSLSDGITRITNGKRLRIKESDRLSAIATELKKLGADIVELEDGLVIRGKKFLKGGLVDSWNDHRIAMALAIASIKCVEPIYLTNYDAVNKSYPRFWDDFKMLGGKISEWNMGE